ncbi:uncharacterized protein LOC127732622 [Mytilus californianus]|uniref:uncharacterized protein LOC127732622 n=1 Tax=Mytilus californianus TaxID=6549 RepID=UPI002246B1FA|nr:uncharacterized protein LOC127732622 [Mytilus californianus]
MKDKPTPYCCFNHYHDKSECKECKPGSKSTDGKRCIPCPPNTYGDICKHNCNCELNQKCDRQIGCINTYPALRNETIIPVKLPVTHESTSIKDIVSSVKPIVINRNSAVLEHKLTTYGIEKIKHVTKTSNIRTTETKQHTEDILPPDTNFIYYVVVAGGLVGWFVFCAAGVKIGYRRLKRKHNLRNQQSENATVSALISPFATESIYDEIEEMSTPNLICSRRHSYLSIQEDEKEDLIESEDKDIVLACEVQINSQKRRSSGGSEKSSLSCGNCQQNDEGDYLHPYTSIQIQEQQTYTTCN